MNVSEVEESTNTLIDLFGLQQSLLHKLKKLQNELQSESIKEKKSNLTADEQLSRLTLAEKNLVSQQNANASRDRITQMTFFAQEAFKSVYACEGRFDKSPSTNAMLLHSKIALKLKELKELNKQLLDKQNKFNELEIRMASSKERLQAIEWKNRDMYALLLHAEAVSDKSNRRKKAEEEDAKTAKLRKSLDESLKELKLRREVFLGLIQAAKVDWFSDDQLRDLVVSLGEPLSLDTS